MKSCVRKGPFELVLHAVWLSKTCNQWDVDTDITRETLQEEPVHANMKAEKFYHKLLANWRFWRNDGNQWVAQLEAKAWEPWGRGEVLVQFEHPVGSLIFACSRWREKRFLQTHRNRHICLSSSFSLGIRLLDGAHLQSRWISPSVALRITQDLH